MSLIEGIGDEVTLVFSLCFIVIVIFLAWLSTHTDDLSLFREMGVIVVELSQRRPVDRNAARDNDEGETEHPEDQIEPVAAEETAEPDSALEQENEEPQPVEKTPLSGDSVNSSSQLDQPEVSACNDKTLQSSHLRNEIDGESDTKENRAASLETESGTELEEVQSKTNESLNVEPSSLNDTELRQRRVQYFQNCAQRLEASSLQNSSDTKLIAHPSVEGDCKNEVSKSKSFGHSFVKGSSEDQTLKSSSSCENQELNNEHEQQHDGAINHEHLSSIEQSPFSESVSSGTNNSREVSVSSSFTFNEGQSSASVSGDTHTQQEPSLQEDLSTSQIRVKLRYLNETQRFVFAKPDDTIGDFRRTHFRSELEENKWVRFIFNGQDLRDDARTLQACNIGHNSTMHCLVTSQERNRTAQPLANEDEEDSFLGTLMYPMFTILLAVVWYFRLTYRQYFSAMSTVCLIGITFILVLSYISSLRVSSDTQQQQQQPPQETAATGQGP